jgi:hypothetical protein
MYNNVINTIEQTNINRCFSGCRVTNENDIGRPKVQWKYLEFKKNLFLNAQPLAIYYRVAAILTNCLTCLDYNSTSNYYNCEPMEIESYFNLIN